MKNKWSRYWVRLQKHLRFEWAVVGTFIMPLAFATNKSASIGVGLLVGLCVATIVWIFVLISNFWTSDNR